MLESYTAGSDESRQFRAASTDPVQRVLDLLTRGGYEPRTAGQGKWESRCPGHKGTRRNLSIAAGSDGAALLRCHHVDDSGSNCSVAAIVAALGIELKDLFAPATGLRRTKGKGAPGSAFVKPPPATGKPTSGTPARKAARFESPREAAEFLARKLGAGPSDHWVYRLADGEAYAAVYRFDLPAGKEYRPVSLDPETGRWLIKDPPQGWTLYRLGEIAGASRVYVHEGERCADLAAGLGLIATTTAHGAESPKRSDLSPLAGKEVVIVPDHDAAGETYASALVSLLAKLDPAPRVKVVRLPGLAWEGDDIEQWLLKVPGTWGAEACKAELERLADAAPVEGLAPVGPNGDGQGPDIPIVEVPAEPEPPIHRTDTGNAIRLIRKFGGRIRYCPQWGVWLAWDGRRWKDDATGRVYRYARKTVQAIGAEAAALDDEDERKATLRWALQSEDRWRIEAMIALSRYHEGIPVEPSQLDQDPMVLNVENGTIDLGTGELRPHRQEDLITKLAPVAFDPAAECPRWDRFLREIFAGDEDLIAYIARALGYSASGSDVVQEINIFHGDGSNGKNVLLDTVRRVLGDYGCKAESGLLLAKRNEDHPTGLADLDGKRFVISSESGDGRRLAESLVKSITGDDIIKARRMRQDFYEFRRTFKVFLATNHRPRIKGKDHGIWRRIRLVPFGVKFVEPAEQVAPPLALRKEEGLIDRLAEEGPGILAWLVRGCLDWKAGGMRPPAAVQAATDEYRQEQDIIGEFIK